MTRPVRFAVILDWYFVQCLLLPDSHNSRRTTDVHQDCAVRFMQYAQEVCDGGHILGKLAALASWYNAASVGTTW